MCLEDTSGGVVIMKVHIADVHREYRKTHAITHQEVAEHVGIARPTYTKILSGSKMPSFPVADRLAGFFGVSLGSIRFGRREGEVQAPESSDRGAT